ARIRLGRLDSLEQSHGSSQDSPHIAHAFYHLTLRGNRRQQIFRTEADHHLFEWLMRDAIARSAVEVHAYCWMPNHVHLLVRVQERPLYRFVQHFASRYATRFNEAHGTVGHLFQGRYWAAVVDSDDYLMATVRYIHLNPAAAGLVGPGAAYPWSSLRFYLDDIQHPWLCRDFVLASFDSSPHRARQRFSAFMRAQPDCPQDAFVALLQEAERRFGVAPRALTGNDRSPDALCARAWLAFHGTRKFGMNLTDVAARLGRSPKTLALGIETWREEIEGASPL
ncbi:MAG: transposase, partial [Gammaproteobacteria bacterium]|nr:transposase [Gammaproteobacteria bacterium]